MSLVYLKTLAIESTKLKANAAREKMLTADTARQRIHVIETYLKDVSEQTDRVEAEDYRRARPAPISPVSSEDIEKCWAEMKQLHVIAAELEAEDAQGLVEEQAAYGDKMAKRQRYQQETGKTIRGRPTQPPGA